MPQNPRKAAFKELILERVGQSRQAVSRAELVAYVQKKRPDLCDDSEPCYPGCDTHPALWRHQLERCIYDLKAMKRPKLASIPHEPGWYTLP